MGIQNDNWPATVGLASGILAKEVVVGTLNTLYTQVANLSNPSVENFHFSQAIHDALVSIPNNLVALKDSLGNPVLASAPDHNINQGVLGVMYQCFDGQLGAMAYLLFVLLYFPCVSATAAMLRESSRRWTIFSVIWTTGLAYAVAVVFYQAATFMRHPAASTLWILSLVFIFIATLIYMRNFSGKKMTELNDVPTQPLKHV